MIDHAFELRFYASNNPHVDDEKLNAAADYIERVKQEQINQRDRAVCAEIERDELAAYVEALKKALEDITQAAQQEGLQFSGWQEQVDNAVTTLLASPATSLARHVLLKQAEAIKKLIQVMRQPMTKDGQPWLIRVEDAEAMANDLLRQAEELTK